MKNRCILFHDYNKWSEPIKEGIIEFRAGKPYQTYQLIQKRSCKICNKIQHREINEIEY